MGNYFITLKFLFFVAALVAWVRKCFCFDCNQPTHIQKKNFFLKRRKCRSSCKKFPLPRGVEIFYTSRRPCVLRVSSFLWKRSVPTYVNLVTFIPVLRPQIFYMFHKVSKINWKHNTCKYFYYLSPSPPFPRAVRFS